MTERRERLARMVGTARALGPAGTARVALAVARGRAVRRWRRLSASVVGTDVGPRDLARALGIPEAALGEAGRRLRAGLARRLPAGPDDAKAIRGALERHAPATIAATLAAADRLRAHVFDLLGSGPVALGPRIDWHRDFKSGHRWDPTCFHADVPLGPGPGVDVKVPWELSRGQHLPVLAQAYLFTGDERYADEAVGQIQQWLVANPPARGVNWACPMDIAIRAVNWLWTAALLAGARAADAGFYVELAASLLAHGRHVAANLEVGPDGVRANHYLADVVGLLYLGLCLPELAEAAGWQAFARRALVAEMARQVGPDGVHYESSIAYHRLAAEMFLSAAVLCRRHGVTLPADFEARLARMIDFTHAYTKPNGLAPQLGDADDGRLHVLTGYGTADPRDHRHLLAAGACYFGREDWWRAAGPGWPEASWLGGAGDARWDRPPEGPPDAVRSVAFPDAGLYVMRRDEDYVLACVGPVGTGGRGAHKHNDLLALEVHLGGADVLVDPGSFCYTPDPAARNAFRGTASHATVMVDGQEQNRLVPGWLFALRPDSRPRVLAWESGQPVDRLVAEHDGYRRLPDPVVHRRAVTFRHDPAAVEVLDELGGRGAHDLVWAFPFAPGCRIVTVAEGWRIDAAGRHVRLSAPRREPGGDAFAVTAALEEGWVSPRYGVREPAPVLRWRWRGPLPIAVRFVIERLPEGTRGG